MTLYEKKKTIKNASHDHMCITCRCPIPGCDGSGHSTGKFLSHRRYLIHSDSNKKIIFNNLKTHTFENVFKRVTMIKIITIPTLVHPAALMQIETNREASTPVWVWSSISKVTFLEVF